jgi:hypothetical protein
MSNNEFELELFGDVNIGWAALQWNSRTFLAYRTESNRIKHVFAGSELF